MPPPEETMRRIDYFMVAAAIGLLSSANYGRDMAQVELVTGTPRLDRFASDVMVLAQALQTISETV